MAVEFALVLPMLCLLVIGGWVLGYMAYAKVALTMAANRAARDFAAAVEMHDALQETNQAYRYDGLFAESFGLPRWSIHALIMKTKVGKGDRPSDYAVAVATCFRLPLTLPFVGGGEAAAEGTNDEVAGAVEAASALERAAAERRTAAALGAAGGLQSALGDEALEWLSERTGVDYQQMWEEAAVEVAEWERLWGEARDLYDRGEELFAKGSWAGDLFRQLLEGPPPDLTPFHGEGADDPERLEEAVRSLCEPPERLRGGAIVVSARSAYLLQEIFEP